MTHGDTGAPVAGATVSLRPSGVAVLTRADGTFELPDEGFVAVPGCRVRVEAEGYKSGEWPCGTREAMDLVLEPAAVRLHEVVVVTSAREPVPAFEAPRAVTVVERGDLARDWPRTTPEALMDAPGLLVQKTNHGGGSPILRGLMGNQVLVLVDGIRLNNATYRYGPNQYVATIDVGSVDRVEVLRGSGAVLFGSDAIGGVVHVMTREPPAIDRGLASEARARWVSGGMERSGRYDAAAAWGPLKVTGGLAVREYGDLRAGGSLGVEAPSAYGEVGGDARASVALGRAGSLVIAYQHVHQSDVPRFDQVRQRGFSRYAFDPQARQLAYVRWSDATASRWAARVEATASWQRSRERRERQRAGQALRIEEEDRVRTLGATVQALAAPFHGATVRYGVDVYHDRVRSGRLDVDTATGAAVARRGLYPDGSAYWSVAGFLHGTWERGRVRAEAGLRSTATRLEARDATFGAIDLGPSASVGTVAASVALAGGARAYGQLAQSFRAPNLDDVSALGAFDFGIEVPSPGLLPERGLEGEGGLKWRAARASAALAVYQLSLSGLVDRVRSTFGGSAFYEGQAVYQRANVGEARVRGAEIEAQAEIAPGWLARGHASATRGEVTTTGQPMRRIPPVNGLLAVRREFARGWVEVAARGAGEQRRLAPGDVDDHRIAPGGTPGWFAADVRASVTLRPGISLAAALENVTDAAYRIHGSGIDEPGRLAWIGIQVGR